MQGFRGSQGVAGLRAQSVSGGSQVPCGPQPVIHLWAPAWGGAVLGSPHLLHQLLQALGKVCGSVQTHHLPLQSHLTIHDGVGETHVSGAPCWPALHVRLCSVVYLLEPQQF